MDDARMLALVKARLQSIGYDMRPWDEAAIKLLGEKVINAIKIDCNITTIPDELQIVAADMVIGEFLQNKKTFAPDELQSIDLDGAVKQLQMGDTTTVFATGDGVQTAEQRLDTLIDRLMHPSPALFSAFRRLRW